MEREDAEVRKAWFFGCPVPDLGGGKEAGSQKSRPNIKNKIGDKYDN